MLGTELKVMEFLALACQLVSREFQTKAMMRGQVAPERDEKKRQRQ